MSPETRRILSDARALIENPANWTQGVYALDADGNDVWPSESTAVCWCLDGALMRASGSPGNGYGTAAATLADYTDREGVIRFNDTHSHAEVLALLDQALQEATP